jgi:hypothetical protein
MSEKIKVGKEKNVRTKGTVLYLGKDGYVWSAPAKGQKGEKKKIGTEKIEREKGFMYFIGKEGFVEKAAMKKREKGSGVKKEKKAPAKKAAAVKKAPAKAAPAKK